MPKKRRSLPMIDVLASADADEQAKAAAVLAAIAGEKPPPKTTRDFIKRMVAEGKFGKSWLGKP